MEAAMRTFTEIAVAALILTLTACGKEPEPRGPAGKPPSSSGIPVSTAPAAEEHSHEGKHGGHVLELGEHEGHLEIVHDAAKGTITAYVSDADMKPVASEAPMINLTKGGVQVAMTPAAGSGPTSDSWTATHEALKADPLDGRIRVKIGSKTFQPPLEDEHEHK
jgi:predicted small lipoprotein YifL